MRVAKRSQFHRGEGPEWGPLDALLDELVAAINSIDIGAPADGAGPSTTPAGNLNAVILVFTTNATPDTDDTKRHGLGRTPKGFIQVELFNKTTETPNAGKVYGGSSLPTNDTATFRCTAASKRACVLLF